MAPEQERGGVTDVDESSDVYALGKLLHFMITSRYLFREELSEAFTNEEVARDERLRAVRDDLLARMIVKNRDERIQSAGEVLDISGRILDARKRSRPRRGLLGEVLEIPGKILNAFRR